PFCRAQTISSLSMTGPRLVLMIMAVFFIFLKTSLLNTWVVSGVSTTWMEMMSLRVISS
ncbi:DUF5067 domain-containing protein, partial [Dysosmobacter welbionis]